MKRILSLVIFFSVAALGASVATPVGQQQADPREGLRAGFRDAGDAAWNMELVINLPKPEGFYDPEQPAGPRRDAEPAGGRGGEGGRGGRGGEGGRGAEGGRGGEGEAAAEQPETPEPPQLSYTNSDIAFSREFLFQGNYHGFNIYNVEDPREAELFASIVCPGGQGDVSVHGDLLFMSVQETRARLDCGTEGVAEPVSEERFRGVRVFDISDMRAPRQVAAVQTCRGSHTHTLIVDPDDADNVYIYNSGTSGVRPAEELPGCAEDEEAADTALFSIDVIQVPLATPEDARIVSSPRVFSDPETGDVSGLWQGGDHGPGTQSSRETRQCHDITAYPEIGLAAGACSGNGILLDISDPVNPTRVDQVVDPNFAFWHSATFNNDGTKVLFSDEWGGGSRPRCRDIDPPTWGGNAIFDIVGGEMRFRGYYKIPAAQTEQENCVAHNGSLVPVPGRDIMVQGWYQGGLSVFDFTDSAQAVEIAYFDRGPVDDESLISGGYWSAYWYNGFVYGAEIARGLDVFRLTPSEYLSQNEIDAAALATSPETNVQHQQRIVWPAEPVVARAYLDQLGRTDGIADERAGAVNGLLDRADGMSSGGSEAAALAGELDGLATELESDAEEAVYQDVRRLQLLAETLRGIGQALR